MAQRQAARLGDLLMQAGAITKDQLGAALNMQQRIGGRLGSTLIEMGLVDERTIASVLAQQLQIPSATAAQLDRAAKGAIERVRRATAERHRVIPIRIDEDRLWVAMVDPTDEEALTAIERETGLMAKPMIAPDILVEFALGKHYGVQRRARFIEARNADLLEMDDDLAIYDPHAPPKPAAVPLGFLDDRGVSLPPAVPAASKTGKHAALPATPSLPPPLPAASKTGKIPALPMPESVPVSLDSVAGPMPTAPSKPAPPAPATLSPPDRLRAKLLAMSGQDDVYDLLLDELALAVPRLALLILRDGALVGHRGRAIDPRVLGKLKLDPIELPALATVLDRMEPYVGMLPDELHAQFPWIDGAQALLLPFSLGKKPMGLVVGAPAPEALGRRTSELQRMIPMLDYALHIAFMRKRLAAT